MRASLNDELVDELLEILKGHPLALNSPTLTGFITRLEDSKIQKEFKEWLNVKKASNESYS